MFNLFNIVVSKISKNKKSESYFKVLCGLNDECILVPHLIL